MNHLLADHLVRDALARRLAGLADARHLAAIRESRRGPTARARVERVAARFRRAPVTTPVVCPC